VLEFSSYDQRNMLLNVCERWGAGGVGRGGVAGKQGRGIEVGERVDQGW
jgi:hypothetical protein